jgi:hypothetical protein
MILALRLEVVMGSDSVSGNSLGMTIVILGVTSSCSSVGVVFMVGTGSVPLV